MQAFIQARDKFLKKNLYFETNFDIKKVSEENLVERKETMVSRHTWCSCDHDPGLVPLVTETEQTTAAIVYNSIHDQDVPLVDVRETEQTAAPPCLYETNIHNMSIMVSGIAWFQN